jgi:hypothetical protein
MDPYLDDQYVFRPAGPVPEIIDPVFVKTIPKRSFSMTEYERFGLVFTNTRVYKFGHRILYYLYGSGSFYQKAKIGRKTFVFFSLKTDVNIPSKSNLLAEKLEKTQFLLTSCQPLTKKQDPES